MGIEMAVIIAPIGMAIIVVLSFGGDKFVAEKVREFFS